MANPSGNTDVLDEAVLAQGGRLWVDVRTPDGPVHAGWAASVNVPGSAGGMGILPRHAPLMSSLDVGLSRLAEPDGGAEHRWITGAGFVEVQQNKVLVLVDFADDPAGIDVERAKAARERARARLRESSEEVDRVRAEAALARAIVRLAHAGSPRI